MMQGYHFDVFKTHINYFLKKTGLKTYSEISDEVEGLQKLAGKLKSSYEYLITFFSLSRKSQDSVLKYAQNFCNPAY